MDNYLLPLNKIPLGKNALVKKLISNGNTRRRMLDLGLINDTQIIPLQISPSGDPTAYHIRGAVIALRSDEASKILVKAI